MQQKQWGGRDSTSCRGGHGWPLDAITAAWRQIIETDSVMKATAAASAAAAFISIRGRSRSSAIYSPANARGAVAPLENESLFLTAFLPAVLNIFFGSGLVDAALPASGLKYVDSRQAL